MLQRVISTWIKILTRENSISCWWWPAASDPRHRSDWKTRLICSLSDWTARLVFPLAAILPSADARRSLARWSAGRCFRGELSAWRSPSHWSLWNEDLCSLTAQELGTRTRGWVERILSNSGLSNSSTLIVIATPSLLNKESEIISSSNQHNQNITVSRNTAIQHCPLSMPILNLPA